MVSKSFLSPAVAIAAATALSTASAADLKIGLGSAVTSMDPLFYVSGAQTVMARNIFDGLINQDENQRLKPALALSWKPIDDTTWEFRLRQGVKFHDGSDFTAEDVAATIRRVPLASQNSPSSFMRYVSDIKEMVGVDPYTIRFKTATPAPLLPNNLSRISMLPSSLEQTSSSALNDGHGVIGTGPFKFVKWQPGDGIELARNTAYWGGAVHWDTVTLKFITNPTSRVAALMAGDVDVIEEVPTTNLETIRKNSKVRLASAGSNRVMYLHMDQDREVSPFAVGPDGKNPLRDVRVRRAMSKAINRQLLVDRIMDGQGVPTGQLVPEGYFGYAPSLEPEKFDLDGAKKLLAEAGYPNGFDMTFHASNDRYPNDEKIGPSHQPDVHADRHQDESRDHAGGRVLPARLETGVQPDHGRRGRETGEASGVLGPLLATFSKDTGQGNRGRYSNPKFDQALGTAMRTVDDAKREKILQDAMVQGMSDVGVIPVFFLLNNWGTRAGLAYSGPTDGVTLANDVPAK
jgi:peptide/nickel transport system substrate-binding protein